jgi:AcrR family transcriptional regulator
MKNHGLRGTTREKLVHAAARLIYDDGIHDTGVDDIVEAADVSKPTLYRYFRSKEEIVTAALELRARNRLATVDQILSGGGAEEEPLLGVFDELEVFFAEPDFRGCALVIAAGEWAGAQPSTRALAADHKRRVSASLERIATERRYRAPASLAQGLLLLIEGATVLAALDGNPRHALDARNAAKTLLVAHRPQA